MAKQTDKKPAKPAKKENPFKDKKFQRFIRNATISAVEKDDGILTGRAAALVNDLDDDEISEICEACHPEESDDEAESATMGNGMPAFGIPRGPFGGKILDFILNIDPRVKQVIIDTILKYIGLKDTSPMAAAASPAASADNQSPERTSHEDGEPGTGPTGQDVQ